jgi:hypothetical protein
LDGEVRGVAGAGAGDAAWVERVAVRTVPERAVSAEGDDVFAELVRSLQATVADDGAIEALGSELASLAEKLPAAVRAEWDPTSPAVVRDLVEDLRHRLPPRLVEERG